MAMAEIFAQGTTPFQLTFCVYAFGRPVLPEVEAVDRVRADRIHSGPRAIS